MHVTAARPPSLTTFDDFYRDRWTPTVRLAHVLTGSPPLAEDLAQEAFAALADRFDSLEHPNAYLRTTLVNLAHSHHRRRARHDQLLHLVDRPTAGDLGASELLDAVDALPYREKAVLVLRYYEDLPEADIATILGCRPATVRTTAARALRRLRREIQP
ncbi:MAG: putative polymerase subfamily sigma factor [Actinomycetia bacterium]|nr:putative polymerase subfamily sigma factor [Actinomycetes bacterium]